MFNFLKNVLIGFGAVTGAIVALALVAVIGGGLWIILSALGLIGLSIVRVLFWALFGGLLAITLFWAVGAIVNGRQ